MAYDDGYYFGQCKLVCVAENVADNGKTVYVTDGTNSWSGLIVSKKATFLLPPRTLYNVKLLSNSSTASYETNVECGYGECIELHLANGYNKVYKKDLDAAVSTLNNTINTTKTQLQTNFQAGVNSIYNAVVAKGITPASKSLSDVVQGVNSLGNGTLVLDIGLQATIWEWGGSGEGVHNNSTVVRASIVLKNGKSTSITYSPTNVRVESSMEQMAGDAKATITSIKFVSWTPHN